VVPEGYQGQEEVQEDRWVEDVALLPDRVWDAIGSGGGGGQ